MTALTILVPSAWVVMSGTKDYRYSRCRLQSTSNGSRSNDLCGNNSTRSSCPCPLRHVVRRRWSADPASRRFGQLKFDVTRIDPSFGQDGFSIRNSNSLPRNSTADRWIAMHISGNPASCRARARGQLSHVSQHRIATMKPRSSATGMNCEGGTMPRSGWRQRMSTSALLRRSLNLP